MENTTSGSEAKDFNGLIDNMEDRLDYAVRQTNLQLVVVAEATTRPGLKEVEFEEF
jgi:hypothetical protein